MRAHPLNDASRRLRDSMVLFAVALMIVSALSAEFALAAPESSPTMRAAEWAAIRQVIGKQLDALKKGDGTKAMSFASPQIRLQFGTPDNFMAMVKSGYGPLLTARYTEFLDGAVIEGAVIQPLRLIAHDNTVLVALYTMEKQKDGRWKIAGCVLAPSTVQAT